MVTSGRLAVVYRFPEKVMFIISVLMSFGFVAMFMVVRLLGVNALMLKRVLVRVSALLSMFMTVLARPCEVTLGIMLLKCVRKLTRAVMMSV